MTTTRNIGFVLPKLSNHVFFTDLFKTIHEFIEKNPFDQIVIFNSFSEITQPLNIPIFHLSHAQFFTGDLFLFDIISAILTKSFPRANNRYIYAQDVPWMTNPGVAYSEWLEIYGQDNLEIIARNKDLYDLYHKCWKKPKGISESFKYEEIAQII